MVREQQPEQQPAVAREQQPAVAREQQPVVVVAREQQHASDASGDDLEYFL